MRFTCGQCGLSYSHGNTVEELEREHMALVHGVQPEVDASRPSFVADGKEAPAEAEAAPRARKRK